MSKESPENEKRVKLSTTVNSKYLELKTLLRERGANEFSFQVFLDSVFTKVPEKVFIEVIEENTPEEYRIKVAMEDPLLRSELLRLIDKKKTKPFGKDVN